MARRHAWLALVLTLILAPPAVAGQASGGFSVGLTITGKKTQKVMASGRRPLRYTWNAAAISVVQAGYSKVARLSAKGSLYWFEASRDGRRYRVAVSISTGQILRVDES